MTTGSASLVTGRVVLGPEIEPLLAADPHRSGSVDAVLLDRQAPVTVRTQPELYAPPEGAPAYERGNRPELERWVLESTAGALHEVQIAVALTRFCARISERFPTIERSTAAGFYGDFATYLCGGTEEEVIKKGSPLAAERARVLCCMAQIAGLHARVIFLARPDPPERHAVTEIFINNGWRVFDGFSGRFYTWPKHFYASAWDLHQLPHLIDNHADHGRMRYVDSAHYQRVAVATYSIADMATYDYAWDPIPPDLADRLRAGLGA